MLEIEEVAALAAHIGECIGVSDWVQVDQPMIDRFADATGDHNWYHVDVERASHEMPDGKTIAHGLLLLALVPGLAGPMLSIKNRKRALNYGSDRVRYMTPVQVGDKIRLKVAIKAFDKRPGGYLLTRECTLESKGNSRMAMLAHVLTFLLE